MFFVYPPEYYYDIGADLKRFETLPEVESFINEDLKRNEEDYAFHHEAKDYIVIEGKELTVTTLKYASVIKINR